MNAQKAEMTNKLKTLTHEKNAQPSQIFQLSGAHFIKAKNAVAALTLHRGPLLRWIPALLRPTQSDRECAPDRSEGYGGRCHQCHRA